MNWETKLENWRDIAEATLVGMTTLSEPNTWPYYESWIHAGHQADMDYLMKHAPLKKDPQSWIPQARSALVFAFSYLPHPEGPGVFKEARTAMYAQGRDYHHWMKERLQKVVDLLQKDFPEHLFHIHTDSSPILERDLAYKAGLGWFGKNTCLIHPKKGSLFLIGEIISSFETGLVPTPLPDFCGTCTRCLEVCPTGALKEPRVLQADLCISYWTIESRKIPPLELRSKFGDRLFGCDLCQTVCPWNQKVFKTAGLVVDPKLTLTQEQRHLLIEELRSLFKNSHNQTQRRIKGTAMARSGAKGLKRNALIVVANQKLTELQDEVQKLLDEPYYEQLAQWVLSELAQSKSPTQM